MSLHGHKTAAGSPVITTIFQQDKEEDKKGKKVCFPPEAAPFKRSSQTPHLTTCVSLAIPCYKGNILLSQINWIYCLYTITFGCSTVYISLLCSQLYSSQTECLNFLNKHKVWFSWLLAPFKDQINHYKTDKTLSVKIIDYYQPCNTIQGALWHWQN